MSEKTRIGILGWGNLGKGTALAASQNDDISLEAVFTRRDPFNIDCAPMYNISQLDKFKDDIDVLILCGGSATDLPVQTPEYSKIFNTVDSFDTHAKIPQHFAAVDAAAKENGKLSLISAGWDPGLFSLLRVYSESVLPVGGTYTFWGKGVSQGHSDAIRRISGVKNGIQYTVPVQDAVDSVRTGTNPALTTRQKHKRLCYVVAEAGADTAKIESEIKNMPNYFADYDTEVNFISEDEFLSEHNTIPHGGMVIRTGTSAADTKQRIEFHLELGSNPEFTGSVLVACSRAVARMSKQGRTGCITLFDVPPSMLSPFSPEELRLKKL